MKYHKKFVIISATLAFLVFAGLFFLSKTTDVENQSNNQSSSSSLVLSGTSSTTGNKIETDPSQGISSPKATSTNASAPATTTAPVQADLSPQDIQFNKSVSEINQFLEQNQSMRQEPLARAQDAKAVYMTKYVANSPQSSTFKNIQNIIGNTEINAVVIDVKDVDGPYLPDSLKNYVDQLHQQGIWVIARIVAFKDASMINTDPEMYIKNGTSSELWKDSSGGYWMDPSSPAVQSYLIKFSKKVIDFGFDELQFDYVRFPSDGNIKNATYPYYDGKEAKYDVIRNFFLNLSGSLRHYKPSIILSADIFGYVAGQYQAPEIGQRIQDVSDLFDFVSFMLYPSHFYNGFIAPADPTRDLPALYYPYASTNTQVVAVNHPYNVVYRSLLLASDYLKKINSNTKIRPWLQDFNLKVDMDRGIYYNATMVKAQIQAAQDASSSGWMLWNPSNVYTTSALLPKSQ